MAEATDRPPSAGEVSSGAIMPAADVDATPRTASEPYRPLSLLALVGFTLAALYTLLVVVGGAVSLFNNVPWLMPTWTFLLPAGVVILCWAARTRIRNSEGTLGGLAFTTWGFRLAVVVALTYAFYYGFTFFAVSLQAKDCAKQFFAQLREGKLERAFLLAMGVATKETKDDDLRDLLEVRFNTPTGPGGASGPFGKFCQSQFVRAILTSEKEVTIDPVGVAEWDYGQGGYRVVLRYQVSTTLANFEMSVETFGRDSKPGEPKGRQWQVMLQSGNTGVLSTSLKLTPQGEDYMRRAMTAQNFANNWQDRLNRMQWEEVYLDTLKPAEREREKKARQTLRLLNAAPVAGLAPLGLYDTACRDFQNGLPKLAQGTLIRIDNKKFWTSKRERETILRQIEQTFQPHPDGLPTFRLQVQGTQMPLSRTVDGERVFLLDANLLYLDGPGGRPKYLVNGEVAVAIDESKLDGPPSSWRIQSIEISSGRTAPGPERPRPGAGPG
jgi:hypothetical protein